MPIEGTRRIELDGREVYLESDLVELEDIVAAGLQLQIEMSEAKEKLNDLKERGLKIAERHRFSKKSLTLNAPSAGAMKVTWGTETTVDDGRARALKQELTPQQFDLIFTEQTEYRPRRGLTSFLRTPQLPDMEQLKQRIASALTISEKAPSVKFIAIGATATDGDDE